MSDGCNVCWPVNERLSYRHKLLQGCPVFKGIYFLLYKKMVCVGATEPEHPRSVHPLPVKPKHHFYQRLHQYSESSAASHTSIQQSGASSGLDHATRSATTDNPQDGSPRSNHWLDTAASNHFGSTEGKIDPHAGVQ